jgi:hypothetical protein
MKYDKLWAALRLHAEHMLAGGINSIHPALLLDKMDDLEQMDDLDDQLENMAIQTGIHPAHRPG